MYERDEEKQSQKRKKNSKIMSEVSHMCVFQDKFLPLFKKKLLTY